MPSRPSKDATFLGMAMVLSSLGTCDRKQVGAIITLDGRCVSWGYNGAPPGLPHCSENNHGIQVGDIAFGCANATHAEANAMAFAARQGISTDGGTLYVTLSPCETCSRLLIAAGIWRVVYWEEYRDPRGLDILRSANVEVEHLSQVQHGGGSGPDGERGGLRAVHGADDRGL